METTTRAQHTPGPWRIEKYGGYTTVLGGTHTKIASIFPNDANARLIAAAPSLLAALEALTEHLDDEMRICASQDGIYPGEDDLAPLLKAADAAIAQARGDA